MKTSLIVCTYKRAKPLLTLLHSVNNQTVYPNEILIIDGSYDNDTKTILEENTFHALQYFKVGDEDRGLTKQRNFGISKVGFDIDIVCFLDDDTVLETNYFKELLNTYNVYPEALGVGGYITNEISWTKVNEGEIKNNIKLFYNDGFKRTDGSRFVLRKRLGLDTDRPPGYLPEFSHGRSISFIPPSGKIYQVEQLMGGVSSFKKTVFDSFQFSTYFQGYGLYEDADFTFRVSNTGSLYINTKARLAHYHEGAGRPNKYEYGKMVVRNGWYVWRVKYPNPSFGAKLKWNILVLLLSGVRFTNIITTSKRKEALTETLGRFVGWFSLIFNKPLKV